jgi:hypothetical protein
MKSLLVAVLACALAAVSMAGAEGTIYKWVDKEGNVHYTDCPPPPGCEAEAVVPPAAPSAAEVEAAQERLESALAEQEQAAAAREQDRLERERQKLRAMQVAVIKKQKCIEARQNLHVLELQAPVYYIDEKGERVFIDDALRQSEMALMRQQIEENCLRE